MTPKLYALITGVIFTLVATMHLCRLVAGWPVVVAGWTVPLWVSAVGLVVASVLACYGLRFGRRG